MGVAQDALALRLMGVDPVRIKTVAFGLGIATASVAGALLIIISPVEPSIGRAYIGRVFAITVLGGLGSIGGTLVAAMILGVAESLTATLLGAVVVAGRLVRHPPARARGTPRGALRDAERARALAARPGRGAAGRGLRRHPHRREPLRLFRRLRHPAVRRPRDRVEHPRRLHRLRELRHRRVLRPRRLHLRVSHPRRQRAAPGADRGRRGSSPDSSGSGSDT